MTLTSTRNDPIVYQLHGYTMKTAIILTIMSMISALSAPAERCDHYADEIFVDFIFDESSAIPSVGIVGSDGADLEGVVCPEGPVTYWIADGITLYVGDDVIEGSPVTSSASGPLELTADLIRVVACHDDNGVYWTQQCGWFQTASQCCAAVGGYNHKRIKITPPAG